MEPIEYFLAFILVVATIFPLGFIFYKRVSNKIFFISAVVGVYTVIELLLVVMVLPIGIFMVKVAPQLAEQGQVIYILPLLYTSDFIQAWWFLILHPILSIWLPLAIYKRYSMFHLTNKAS